MHKFLMLGLWFTISARAELQVPKKTELGFPDCFYRFSAGSKKKPFSIHDKKSYLLAETIGGEKGFLVVSTAANYFFKIPKDAFTERASLVMQMPGLRKIYANISANAEVIFSEEGTEDPWTKAQRGRKVEGLMLEAQKLEISQVRGLLLRDLEAKLETLPIRLHESLEIARKSDAKRGLSTVDEASQSAKEHLKSSQWPEGLMDALVGCRPLWGETVAAVDEAIAEVKKLQNRYMTP